MIGKHADEAPRPEVVPDREPVFEAVVKAYSEAARLPMASSGSCCASCGCGAVTSGNYDSGSLGELAQLGAYSLGCGNPIAEAELRPGEIVLDLGSGAGLDTFLAAERVGPRGLAIGLDATPEMATLAERNRETHGMENARFILGRMEAIPLLSASVDAIVSNCVLNLSLDKRALAAEAFRVLKPGGRLVASDILAGGPLSDELRRSAELWSACFAGALTPEEWTALLSEAGFCDVLVEPSRAYTAGDLESVGLPNGAPPFLSAVLRARRPR